MEWAEEEVSEDQVVPEELVVASEAGEEFLSAVPPEAVEEVSAEEAARIAGVVNCWSSQTRGTRTAFCLRKKTGFVLSLTALR